MTAAHRYRAQYDYVELLVEQRGDHWVLTLRDTRHGENIVHEEKFSSADEARDAALPVAEHHIHIQHNDTLLNTKRLSWQMLPAKESAAQ